MKVALTEFAKKRHFPSDSSRAGTIILGKSPEEFENDVNLKISSAKILDGYAPFCKLVPLENWTQTKSGIAKITPKNERFLKTDYKARVDGELPVLVRWFDGIIAPIAKYLILVLYSKEQIVKETDG